MTEGLPENFFEGLPRGASVMVAYSGGVDSAVTAEIFREAGFIVHTVTMSLFKDDTSTADLAEASAKKAGFIHHTLDLADAFKEKIMHRTWLEYSAGLTPNPCSLCNPLFKFGALRDFALENGCAAMATGHYVRIERSAAGKTLLKKGLCLEKDQSYFLYRVPSSALAFCRTPLGWLQKPYVKEYAAKLGLPASERKESQDICFGGDDLPATLSKMFPEPPRTGDFVSDDGRVLGRNRGIQFCTIGQRKGTGIALGVPAYVSSINGADCSVVLTTDPEKLMSSGMDVKDCNFLADTGDVFSCSARTRYRSRAVSCTVEKTDGGNACHVIFDSPVRAVAPGQAAVFYSGDLVLGGGVIAK